MFIIFARTRHDYMSYNHLHSIPTLYLEISINYIMNQIEITKTNNQINEEMANVVTEKYARIILQGTMNHPKSARDISAEYNIPLSTVYRRLETLLDKKLLITTGVIVDDGKKSFLYQSRAKKFSIHFDQNTLQLELFPNHR